jgi:hypothetical protein
VSQVLLYAAYKDRVAKSEVLPWKKRTGFQIRVCVLQLPAPNDIPLHISSQRVDEKCIVKIMVHQGYATAIYLYMSQHFES